MNRRELAARLVVAALATSGAVKAPPVRKIYRIGVLGLGAPADLVGPNPSSPSLKALIGGSGTPVTSTGSTTLRNRAGLQEIRSAILRWRRRWYVST